MSSRGTDRSTWTGVHAAIPTLFDDAQELALHAQRAYLDWLLAHDGVAGVVAHANGGEVASLEEDETIALSAAVVEHVDGRVPVTAGLRAEGLRAAVTSARHLEDAGVDALLVMPPQRWLRSGKPADEAVAYFHGIAEATELPLIVHEYPATTKAGYSTEELVRICGIDRVVAVKSGTRNMAIYTEHVARLRQTAPDVAILTCHDEALLPTLAPRVDGALVTLGSLIPTQLAHMVERSQAGDLDAARQSAAATRPITQLFYGPGLPTPRSHALLKAALNVLDVIPNTVIRAPLTPIDDTEMSRVRDVIAPFVASGELGPTTTAAASR